MNAFTDDPANWQRLDWRLLQNSSVTLYHSRAILAGDLRWFTEHGYTVRSLEPIEQHSSDDFLAALGQVLRFPDYFGGSLDAFNDCLSDIEIPEESGLVLVLEEFQRVSLSFPPVAQAVLDILAMNSRRFLLTGRRFLILVQSSDPRIAFEGVGATPVLWNPQEWLDSKRGL
jgi:RNAse (barnase) inhibitor barstar